MVKRTRSSSAEDDARRVVVKSEDKPDHGRIANYHRIMIPDHRKQGLGYFLVGNFLDPPYVGGAYHTAEVVHHNERSGTVETLNAKHKLVEVPRAKAAS